MGDNKAVFVEKFDLDCGEPAIPLEVYETSHLERSFDGVKMVWAREDWIENTEEVLREEERVREKIRKDRKERNRKGGLSAVPRRRKWRLIRMVGMVMAEEKDADMKMEVGDAEEDLGR